MEEQPPQEQQEEQASPEAEVVGGQPMGDFIQHPAKLLRIASMVRELLEEVRQSEMDESGRKRLMEVYERSVEELRDSLSEDLRRELENLAIPFEGVPSEAEIRVAQAQLVGWLEGLFHGIQAALWTQHMQARAQLDEMRRRSLPSGQQLPPGQPGQPGGPGQYL